MSEENVEIVRRMLDQAPQRPAALYEILAEDVDWEASAAGILELATCHGRDEVMEFFRRWAGTFHDWDYETEEVIDAGDSVVVRIHQWGRGKGSGAVVENRFWQVWTLRDGKVIKATHHAERDQALEAARIEA